MRYLGGVSEGVWGDDLGCLGELLQVFGVSTFEYFWVLTEAKKLINFICKESALFSMSSCHIDVIKIYSY